MNGPAIEVLVLSGGIVFVEVERLALRIDVAAIVPKGAKAKVGHHELAKVIVLLPIDHVGKRMHVDDIESQRVKALVGKLMDIGTAPPALIRKAISKGLLAGDQVLVGQRGFGLANKLCDSHLPRIDFLQGRGARFGQAAGFIADFVNDVVVAIGFLDDLADVGALPCK